MNNTVNPAKMMYELERSSADRNEECDEITGILNRQLLRPKPTKCKSSAAQQLGDVYTAAQAVTDSCLNQLKAATNLYEKRSDLYDE